MTVDSRSESDPCDDSSSESDEMPSSALDQMLEGFGIPSSEPVSTPAAPRPSLLPAGHRVSDRYTIISLVDRWTGGAFYRAYDVVLERDVVLKSALSEGSDAIDELQRQELLLARALSHPHVCRVHDLVQSEGRRFLVMEAFDATLAQCIDLWRRRHSRPLLEAIRSLVNGIASGLHAVHERGLVHGALNPMNIALHGDRPLVLFGPATERERVLSGCTPAALARIDARYFSPERLAEGHTGRSDDIYALGLMTWQLLSAAIPSLGVNPRDATLLQYLDARTLVSLSVDELRVVYECLAANPTDRPRARHVRLGVLSQKRPIEGIDAGPPPGAGAEFTPGSQALLVTVAPTAPRLVGELHPLMAPELQIGRHGRDLALAERTLSSRHATFRWSGGSWAVTDLASRNGIYLDHSSRRRADCVLRQGDEIQLGELRVKLVAFTRSSVLHWRAKRYLDTHDGLTGMVVGPSFLAAAEDAARFADWSGTRLSVARFRLSLAKDGQATTLMLGTRRAARHLEEALASRWAGVSTMGFLRRDRIAPGGVVTLLALLVGRGGADLASLAESIGKEASQLLPSGCKLETELNDRREEQSVLTLIAAVS